MTLIGTWRQAHRIAQLAAVHAQHELHMQRDGYVDVFAAIRCADVALMFRDMPGHFGTYISPSSNGPGILINSGLSMPTIRHTAAHELGHHQLGHGDSVDQDLDPWESQTPGAWTGPEMSAEAFAAWFLMPRPAVLRGLQLLGTDRPQSAQHAYRLATLLGASYRGVCRHLVNLKLVSTSVATAWAKTGRARVRTSLAGPYAQVTSGEVHVLDSAMHDLTVRVSAGDLLVTTTTVCAELTAVGHAAVGLERLDPVEEQLDLLDEPRMACWRVTGEFTAPAWLGSDDTITTAERWSVLIEPVSVRNGIDLEWLERRQQRDHNT